MLALLDSKLMCRFVVRDLGTYASSVYCIGRIINARIKANRFNERRRKLSRICDVPARPPEGGGGLRVSVIALRSFVRRIFGTV